MKRRARYCRRCERWTRAGEDGNCPRCGNAYDARSGEQ